MGLLRAVWLFPRDGDEIHSYVRRAAEYRVREEAFIRFRKIVPCVPAKPAAYVAYGSRLRKPARIGI